MTETMVNLLHLSMTPGLKNLSVDETRAFMHENAAAIDDGVADAFRQLELGEDPRIVLSLLDTSKSVINRIALVKRVSRLAARVPESGKLVVLAATRPEWIDRNLRRLGDTAVCNFFVTRTGEVWLFICQNLGEDQEIGYAALHLVDAQAAKEFTALLENYLAGVVNGRPNVESLSIILEWFGSAILRFFLQFKVPERVVFIPHRSLHCLPLHAIFATSPTETVYLDMLIRRIGYSSSLADLFYGRGVAQKETPSPLEPRILAVLDVQATGLAWLRYERDHFELLEQLGMPVDVVTRTADLPTDKSSYVTINWSGHGRSDPSSWAGSYLTLGSGNVLARDISQTWTLSRRPLVTLAACETALDTSSSAVDEYCGLDFAFKLAGAAAVFATLWRVSDPLAALASVILAYWSFEHKVSPAEALVRFQQGLRNGTWQQWLLSDEQLAAIPRDQERVREILHERRQAYRRLPLDYFSAVQSWATFRCFGQA